MLIDEVTITIKGGKGGDGKVSFPKSHKLGPDGGNGGDGGDVYFIGIDDLYALNPFTTKKVFSAQDGGNGSKNLKHGKNGDDLLIPLPVGTVVIDINTNQELFTITQKDQRELICTGGKGGLGNNEFKSGKNTSPKYAERGEYGQEKELLLNLKLIADIGLIGLPNSGKSSLLNELTNANAKIGDYNFTTLSPNLGTIKKKVIADIPGLIEGASEGKGLGISFLKHIERVNRLIHCISAESSNPKNDYQTVRKELEKYNPLLLKKPEIIVFTKSDLVEKNVLEKKQKELGKKSLTVSIHDWESLDHLGQLLK